MKIIKVSALRADDCVKVRRKTNGRGEYTIVSRQKGRRAGLKSTERFQTICMRDFKGNENYKKRYYSVDLGWEH